MKQREPSAEDVVPPLGTNANQFDKLHRPTLRIDWSHLRQIHTQCKPGQMTKMPKSLVLSFQQNVRVTLNSNKFFIKYFKKKIKKMIY